MAQYSLQKPKQYLNLDFVSSTAYTSVLWHCCQVSCMRMRKCKRIELRTRKDGPHPSQRANANSSCIESTYVLAPLERQYYWTIEAGMIENRLSCLSLCERLGGPLSLARERQAFCASALGMHLHDRPCMPPCLCTRPYCPERSESASFMSSR